MRALVVCVVAGGRGEQVVEILSGSAYPEPDHDGD